MLAAEPRVQVQYAGEWVFGVLPDVQWGLDPAMQDAGRLQFAFCGRWLITSRRHALRAVDELRRKVAAGLELDHPAEAWGELVERYVELNEVRLHQLSEDVDRIEARLLSEEADPDGLALGPVRRELSRRRREVSALRTALGRAALPRNNAKQALPTEQLPMLMHEVEDFDREVASLQERARLLHEEIDTRIAGDANRSMRALTVFSTLLIPPTLIVGALGMNLDGIPFAHGHGGFLKATLLCFVTVGAALALLRRWRVI
jgi:zinc transporter